MKRYETLVLRDLNTRTEITRDVVIHTIEETNYTFIHQWTYSLDYRPVRDDG